MSSLSNNITTLNTKITNIENTGTTVTKATIGLGNVDNTADSAKSVKSATQLTTARTIWGQSFNGTGNVSGSMTGVSDITMSGNIKMGDATISYDSSEKCIKFSF